MSTRGVQGLVAAALGAAVGLGGMTFEYAEGASYLSEDPSACVNCHIMRPQYDAWQKASHHAAAGCVDCHLPHSGIRKIWAKARNGWNHSLAFTLQNFPEPIRITPANAALLEENCLRCHGALLHPAGSLGGSADGGRCVHCHWRVGHGDVGGLGGAGRDRVEKGAEP